MASSPTPGPWEVDTLQSEGEYGSGPDTVAGFAVSAILDAKGNVLFDALNSDAIEVHEDYDEDGCVAYDAVSAANAALIVTAVNERATLLATNAALVKALATTLGFARLKWGNLDPDANIAFERADAALLASVQP